MDLCQLPVAEKNFHSHKTIDNRSCVHQAKTDQFEVKKEKKGCFGMICRVIVGIVMCWCLALWCCISGTAVSQRVYCALL